MMTIHTTLLALTLAATPAAPQTPVDRLIEYMAEEGSVPDEALELIRKSWTACKDCDGEEFLTQALALFYPKFRDGLDAYDADQLVRCAEIMSALRSDQNYFIAVNSAAYEIKALVGADRLEKAGERIEELMGDDGVSLVSHSYFAAEVEFLRGYCFLGDLEYDRADVALKKFLAKHRNAAQRLTVSARQMLLELANRQPGRIGEVVDLMSFAGRRLALGDTGGRLFERQSRAVELLDRLIEEAEEQEQSQGGGGNPQGRSPGTPMPESRLPQGGASEDGSLGPARRANPAEAWGSLPPAQRERVLQALRESFPSRYRQLAEQYYEELSKK